MSIADPGLDGPHGIDDVLPYRLISSEAAGWLVFASPHSGRIRPADMGEAAGLSEATLRSAEDVWVDRLIAPASALGVPIIAGQVSRSYVDLNRDPSDLDPELIEGCPTSGLSAKVAAGFGVIPRRAGDGALLYDRHLSIEEARSRIERVHRPYHAALDHLMQQARARHGRTLLIDWHSMPARATRASARGVRGVDVILGDRHGASCQARTVRRVRAIIEAEGLRVGLNTPYAGGYSTQLWGRPADGFEAIQIELSRALYLDERTYQPSADHGRFQTVMMRIITALAALPLPR